MSGVEFLFYTFFVGFSGFLIGVGFAIWVAHPAVQRRRTLAVGHDPRRMSQTQPPDGVPNRLPILRTHHGAAR